jgi:hypothetical protein
VKTLTTKQEPKPMPFPHQPRPKYEVPQEDLEEVTATDPDAAHIDPALVAKKPSERRLSGV